MSGTEEKKEPVKTKDPEPEKKDDEKKEEGKVDFVALDEADIQLMKSYVMIQTPCPPAITHLLYRVWALTLSN